MRQTPDKMSAFMAQLKKKMNLKSLVVTLAAIVVFTTTYLLILPAFTLDKEEAAEQGGIDVVAVETAAEQADAEDTEQADAADAIVDTADVKEEAQPAVTDDAEKAEAKDSKSETGDKGDKSDVKLLTKKKTISAEQARGDDFAVSAVVGKDAKVPADVTITATELDKKTDGFDYDQYKKDTLKALKEDSKYVKGIKNIKFYDISLESESQDDSVEPAAPVSVKIAYENGMKVDNADNIRIVHFAEQNNGEEKPVVLDAAENNVETATNANGSKVTEASFYTDGFSKYAVVEVETIEKTITTPDGETYKVTVKYGDEAGIPEGATLDVEELTGAKYDEYLEKVADKLGKSAEDLGFAKFFDITIKNGDEEVKIDDSVKVEIKLQDKKDLGEDTKVLHFADDNKIDVVENEAAGNTVKFEAEGFSVYAIVEEEGIPQPPRVTFEFEDPNNPGFYFIDKAGNHQNTQIIKDGEVLQDVGLPTIPEGETFGGWFIYNGNTTVEAVNFESPISVAYGDTSSLSASSITINPDDLNDDDGTYHVKVKAFFGEVVYLTFYEDAAGNNILNKIQIAKGSNYDIATQTLNAPNSELAFGGWAATAGQNDDNRTAITPTALTNITADRSFYPIFKSGHWLTFHSGATGSGATYRAPAFVMAGETAASAQPANPTWKGYAFRYWTETNLYTGDHGAYVQPSSAPARFNFNTTVNESKTLYAYWTPADTTYTVVFWKQNVTDDKSATDAQKTYMFAEQITETGTTGTTVNAADYANRYTGFTLNSNKSDRNVVVKADGTSIINIYFDRNLITMNFNQDIPVYEKTTATTGTQYGLVDGEYVQLTRNGNNWTYSSYEYTPTTSTSGTQYGLVDGEYVELTNYNGYWYYEDGYYYQRYSGTRYTRSTIQKNYTGDRYTRSTTRSFTGLYGQTLAQNGYSWPSNYIWGYSGGTMSFLGQFVLPNANDTSISFTSGGTATKTMYFFLQNIDGTYPTTYSDRGSGTSLNTSFNVTNKYDGFKPVSYQRGNTGNGATGNWTATAVGSSINISNYNTLGIRYEREHFKLQYLDSVDNTKLSGIQDKDVVYGASLSGCKPPTSFTPVSQYPGKVWDGKWYKDQACTEEFDWSVTMPNADVVVYAGWEDVQYKVDIDPNGGVLTSGESTFTWLTYGRTIEHYQDVVRDYVEDPNGSYKYESFLRSVYLDAGYDPWDYRGTVRTAKYVSNETSTSVDLTPYTPDSSHQAGTVNYPYDSTRYKYEEGAYALIGWYELTFADGHYGDLNHVVSEKPYSFDTKIDHDTYIQAKWRRVGDYHVDYMTDVYLMDEDGNVATSDSGIDTTNVPNDSNSYADLSQSAIMRSPDSPITVGTGEDAKQYVFEGWYYDGQLYTPGDVFTVKASLAVDKVIGQDEATGEDITQKTVNIYPVYRAVDDMPVDTTHIFWYSNWKDTDGNVIEDRTEANQLKDETNDKLQPNKAIDIMNINDLLGTNTDYEGYTFKGWARVPETVNVSAETFNANDYMYLYWDGTAFHVGSETGTVVTEVAADENHPYHDMYAVWEINKYTVTIKKSVDSSVAADQHVGFTFAPEFTKYSKTKYSNFILAGERTEGTSEEGQSYVYETSKTFTEVPYGATLKLTETTGSEFTASATYTFTTEKDGTAIPTADQESKEYKNGVDTLTISGDVTVAYTNTRNTQQVKIYKVDADTNAPLGNAKFTLNGQTITSSDVQATKGYTEIVELDVSDEPYELKETEAPAGYNPPENSYYVTVNGDGVTYRTSVSERQEAEYDEGSKAYVITITNTSGTPLPHTGGIGTTIFYIFGSILVVGCGIVLVSRKRMGSNK